MKPAILTDVTKCIGCGDCVVACKKTNHLAPDVPRRWDVGDGLTARNWTSIVDGPANSHVRKQCRHCLDPACVSACPVAAMQKTALGPVIYDPAKCMGCRYCMMACPYEIPRYDWEATIPYVRKCILCYDRVKQGQQPACTEACPAKATVFGDRDALLAEAHRRIELHPDLYINKVWGETDAGGSSVLYISGVDLSFLTGNAPVSGKPLPTLTSVAMESVPFVFCGVLGVMGGVSWIIERRIKRQKESEDGQSSET